jgi:carbamate kinase
MARHEVSPLPLGVLVAATAGWMGYMVQQSLENLLRRNGSRRDVATVITQIHVAPDDPALQNPQKFIGHEIPADRVAQLEAEGNIIKPDGRKRMRRVVGSPVPLQVHELEVIRHLVDRGTIVVACGGGGAPIYYDNKKQGWEGVDAVIDKDLASAVLARDLNAELLVILTDVDAIYVDWGTPNQRALRTLTVQQAEEMDAAKAFGEGSMAPKVRAAIDFVRRTGGRAVITELSRGREAVRGEAGTTITAENV